MKDKVVQTISIPANQVHWEKIEKEIILEGRMFDIRQYSISNGIFTATGHFDEKETMIRDFLKTAGSREQTASVIRLLFFAQCFALPIGWMICAFSNIPNKKQKSFYSNLYTTPARNILVPPPRFH